ncbi:MAG: response regulator [Magnetococcales bacterium]|nr:response regulator [Magnetococcales bacterium]
MTMIELIFKSAGFGIILVTFLLLLRTGTNSKFDHLSGWPHILAGFFFLLIGRILVFLEAFPSFNSISQWHEMVGTFPGFLLLAFGFHRWFPEVIKSQKSEKKLRQINESLAHRMDERKQAMRELAKARDLAEQANQAKDAFLATMSHEIRTPMNIVLGMQELLKDAQLSPKYQEYLHLSITAGKRLLFLLNDLLDFAQIDQGKFTLDNRDFDLRKLMDEVTTILAPLASTKGVELTAHISSKLPTAFRGDPNRLGQIFTNLITNAIKFTPKGGCVDLHGGPISRFDGKTEFLFEIRDTGIGIPEDKREAIFTRFTQIDNSTSRTHEGTGLGLAICKHLVRLMEGEIGVDTNIHSQTGSTFFFNIILEDQKGPEETCPSSFPLKGYEIRLFNCDGLQRTMLTDHLERWGAQVYSEQEQTNSNEVYDIAIVNHKPGGEKDFLPLEHLTQKNRLLILTDLLDQAWDQAAFYKGSISCLQKPVSADRLLKAILTPYTEEHSYNDSSLGTPHHIIPEGSILIVDDHTTNLLLTKALLKKIGFPESAIDLADSGKQALEKVAGKSYQLVLLDLRMPNMDGFETTRAIRAAETGKQGPPLPIIAFTGDITKKCHRKCLQAKMMGLLEKPTSLESLQAVIQEYFSFIPQKQNRPEPSNETALSDINSNSTELLTAAFNAMGLPSENHHEVAEVLFEQLSSLLNELHESLNNQEEEKALSTAHILKGSMANDLFPSLKEPAIRIHKRIGNKDWQHATDALHAYQTILQPIMNAIQVYIRQKNNPSTITP